MTAAEFVALPHVAVIVNGPPTEFAVNSPVASIDPPPLVIQEMVGGTLIKSPNWFDTDAENEVLDPQTTLDEFGLTTSDVGVELTVTTALLVVVWDAVSVMVAVSV